VCGSTGCRQVAAAVVKQHIKKAAATAAAAVAHVAAVPRVTFGVREPNYVGCAVSQFITTAAGGFEQFQKWL
jgi:hypothetical protein